MAPVVEFRPERSEYAYTLGALTRGIHL